MLKFITKLIVIIFVPERTTSEAEQEAPEKSNGNSKNKKSKKKFRKTCIDYAIEDVEMKSELLLNVLDDDLLARAKMFVRTLLLSEFDSHQGINLTADIPRCCTQPVINIKRPAVLRIYYGISEYNFSTPYVDRPTYGPTRLYSSVGIDPNQYQTKPFTPELLHIACHLKKMVNGYSVTGFDSPMEYDFNHCTVLVYRSEEGNNSNTSLSYHCDTTYDTNGNFVPSKNTQLQNSSVLVLTLGDPRTLRYALRISMGNKWLMTKTNIPSTELIHNSLFILHHNDEIPLKRDRSKYLSQIMHGGITMSGENKLSIALCFRSVTKKRKFDPISNLLKTSSDDMTNFQSQRDALDAKEYFTRNESEHYQKKFHNFVKNKFNEWRWFSKRQQEPKEKEYLDLF